MAVRVHVARTVEEIEALKPVWAALPWEREEAELDSFLTRLRARPGVIGPFALVVYRDEEPCAALLGRLETRRLSTNVGYRVVYAPALTALQVVDGGVTAVDDAAISPLVAALGDALARGEADAVALPPLPVNSELFARLK